MSRVQRGLALLTVAFVLRLGTVMLGLFAQRFTGHVHQLVNAVPLVVALVTLLGFQLVGRGDARSALFAQITAALAATESLFYIVIVAAPERLLGFDGLPHLMALLSLLVVLAGWAALTSVVEERSASVPAVLSALFYFAVAMSIGLHVERVLQHRAAIDAHHLDPAGAASLLVSLAVPLVELLVTGIARRAGKDAARPA